MRRILDWYIAKEVIKGSLVAVLVLLSLLSFFTFADELGDVGKGEYDINKIFVYLALTLPRNFYELLPSASLVGCLVTLGALANNRELVAMQAAGIPKSRIVGSVLLGGVVLLLISILVGEFIAPDSERAAQNMKSFAQSKQITSRSRYGFWVRDGNIYVNIRKILEKQGLGDITIYEVDSSQHLVRATHADRAIHDGRQWRLTGITSSSFEEDKVSMTTLEYADWSSVLAPDLLNAFVIRPENLSARELFNYMEYLNENGQKSMIVEQAFWGRLVNPFATLVMLLVATPFVLTVRREVGMGQRIVVGVVIGLGFYLFDKMFNHLGLIYEFNPVIAVSFPTLLALSGVLLVLQRMRKT